MSLQMSRCSATAFIRALLAPVLMMASLALACSAQIPSPDSSRSVIAVGDVHGDLDDFVLILRQVGLIDPQRHWIGGKATLVQVGNLLDLGPKDRDVMDLLISLENEAPKPSGQVVVLLANHEVMNIMGDLRFVAAASFASFADNNSEARRQSAYKDYLKWYNDHTRLLAELPPGFFPEQSKSEWMAKHPLGFIERREAFAPSGQYGKWLREHAAVAKIGNTVFLHGGIHPRLASMSLDAINARIRDELHSFDNAVQYLLEQGLILPFFTLDEINAAVRGQMNLEMKSPSPDERRIKPLRVFLGFGSWLCIQFEGPLWFSGYTEWSDEEGVPQVDKVLQAYDVAHLAVGYAYDVAELAERNVPQMSGRIVSRFGGKVLLIDTGMLRSYFPSGRVSALEIQNQSRFVARYLDHEEVLIK